MNFSRPFFFYGRFVSVPPVSSVDCRRACSPSVFLALQRARVLCFGVFPCARREIAKILHLGLEETGSLLFRDHRSPRRADICFGLTNAVLRLGRSCLAATETLSWQVAAARSFPDTGQLPRPRFSVVRSYCGSSKWKHYICLPVGFFVYSCRPAEEQGAPFSVSLPNNRTLRRRVARLSQEEKTKPT